MESHFMAYMYRLRLIDRWSLMRHTEKDSVAQHSLHVALLAHALCTIATSVYGRSVPTGKIVCAALFHDATEVITGDIPTPVKHHNPEILKNFRAIESMASQRLLAMIPKPLRAEYEDLFTHQTDDVQMWVKAADQLDAYIKCTVEVASGNREFAVARDQYRQRLVSLQMPEMDYFLSTYAPSFERSLDELQ